MELKVSNYSISKLEVRIPLRWKIEHVRLSDTGEIKLKVEIWGTAVGFKTYSFYPHDFILASLDTSLHSS